ncbi:GNAT family N-acetyltransferase [Nocardiopsis sp. LOL_012]|uniref:GNAT family N-acetyltransferase n=1 Tax=Nocardiopsis sp. LOL_012 TaxID=3345409 RepID=UPI003A87E52F
MDTVRAYAWNMAEMRRHLLPGRTVAPGIDLLQGGTPPLTWISVWEPTRELTGKAREALSDPGSLTVEDPFGLLELSGTRRTTRPIMRRPAAIPLPEAEASRKVRELAAAELPLAERVIVDGFPMPALQPYSPSRLLPTDLLDRRGWRAWAIRRLGACVSTALTFDDDNTVCVYWMATLPEHRSLGLARQILSALVRGHEGRDIVLVATEDGQPLYESLGFVSEGACSLHQRSD